MMPPILRRIGGIRVFETLTGYIGAASMLLVGILAFSMGGKPERIGTGAFILAWLLTLIVHNTSSIIGVQWGFLAIDTAALVVFGGLVWKSGRAWPVWACALQLLAVASHIMVLAKLPTPVSSFYTVINLTSYGILVSICFGIFFAWQEQRAAQLSNLDQDQITIR